VIDAPQVVEIAAQQAAVIHVTVSRDEIRTAMGAGYRELMSAVTAQGMPRPDRGSRTICVRVATRSISRSASRSGRL
jgi:hypothetical protein